MGTPRLRSLEDAKNSLQEMRVEGRWQTAVVRELVSDVKEATFIIGR